MRTTLPRNCRFPRGLLVPRRTASEQLAVLAASSAPQKSGTTRPSLRRKKGVSPCPQRLFLLPVAPELWIPRGKLVPKTCAQSVVGTHQKPKRQDIHALSTGVFTSLPENSAARKAWRIPPRQRQQRHPIPPSTPTPHPAEVCCRGQAARKLVLKITATQLLRTTC